MDDIEPVKQVFAEGSGLDALEQGPIRGTDHAHVNSGVPGLGADPLNLAVLEEAQQQGLHLQAHLANFVEEHCSTVGLFEVALAVPMGAGKAAALMAKQLRREKRVWNSSAVDRNEWLTRAAAAFVN